VKFLDRNPESEAQ